MIRWGWIPYFEVGHQAQEKLELETRCSVAKILGGTTDGCEL